MYQKHYSGKYNTKYFTLSVIYVMLKGLLFSSFAASIYVVLSNEYLQEAFSEFDLRLRVDIFG